MFGLGGWQRLHHLVVAQGSLSSRRPLRGLHVHAPWRRSPHRTLNLDHHQRRTNRDHFAFCARHFTDNARNRAFHLDGRLVGHHVGKRLVFLDPVARLDMPGDDFGLGNAFADVRQLECERAMASILHHRVQWHMPMRTGPGK
jgi:hypothetical protein